MWLCKDHAFSSYYTSSIYNRKSRRVLTCMPLTLPSMSIMRISPGSCAIPDLHCSVNMDCFPCHLLLISRVLDVYKHCLEKGESQDVSASLGRVLSFCDCWLCGTEQGHDGNDDGWINEGMTKCIMKRLSWVEPTQIQGSLPQNENGELAEFRQLNRPLEFPSLSVRTQGHLREWQTWDPTAACANIVLYANVGLPFKKLYSWTH